MISSIEPTMQFYQRQGRRRSFLTGIDRRRFLATMGLGGLFYWSRGAFADTLVLTPSQTIGPYYPDKMPLDLDNDLLVINDNITPGVGRISWVSGRILDQKGQPVSGALVEIWQADNNGAYIHSASPTTNRDTNFQGYGRFLTGSSGEYLFRTVKPGLYPGRTRHIHFSVTAPGQPQFTTQLYIAGEPLNAGDGVLNGIRDTAQRNSVVLPWNAIPESSIGELSVKFDIVLGYTPSDAAVSTRPTMVSVVNAANSRQGVASAAWVTVFGSNLAGSTRTWNSSDIVDGKLPRSLDGVSVSINSKPAAVHSISPTQLSVQAPTDTTVGNVAVIVTNNNGTSDPLNVNLQPLMPALFLFPQDYVAAARVDGPQVGPANLIDGVTTTPARPGETILLYGTGFGPGNPDVPGGETVTAPVPLANTVRIQIDTVPAEVSYAGLASAGLYQFNVQVPDLPDGDHAVTASVNGVRTERIGRLRIQR